MNLAKVVSGGWSCNTYDHLQMLVSIKRLLRLVSSATCERLSLEADASMRITWFTPSLGTGFLGGLPYKTRQRQIEDGELGVGWKGRHFPPPGRSPTPISTPLCGSLA